MLAIVRDITVFSIFSLDAFSKIYDIPNGYVLPVSRKSYNIRRLRGKAKHDLSFLVVDTPLSTVALIHNVTPLLTFPNSAKFESIIVPIGLTYDPTMFWFL
jgi:hypothetical protein